MLPPIPIVRRHVELPPYSDLDSEYEDESDDEYSSYADCESEGTLTSDISSTDESSDDEIFGSMVFTDEPVSLLSRF